MSNPPPPPPYAASSAPGTGTAPAAVRTAATLVYVLLAVNAIRTLAAIVAKDSLVDAWLEDQGIDPDSSSVVLRDGAPAYVAIAIISLVVFGVLMVVLAQQFLRGKKWARIVATILAVLGVLGGVLSFAQPAPIWYQLLGVLAAVVSAAIIYFLYRPESNAFFQTAP